MVNLGYVLVMVVDGMRSCWLLLDMPFGVSQPMRCVGALRCKCGWYLVGKACARHRTSHEALCGVTVGRIVIGKAACIFSVF